MRIIFAGTPDFAAAHLKHLSANQHSLSEPLEIVAVYTQPDRKAGRGKKIVSPPVKVFAQEQGIPVYQPLTLKPEEELQQLKSFNCDVMVVAAYGMLLPKEVLEVPRLGCINVHASLLPRWRGAAPIERAIIGGDKESGVTIMQMDVGLDTGDMLLKKSCEISPSETGDSLREKLITLGQTALLESLEQLIHQRVQPIKQDDSQSCYAPKLKKAEGQVNWLESAEIIARKIRAFTSSLASFSILSGERIRINQATAGTQRFEGLSEKLPGEIIAVEKDTILVACGADKQRGVLAITQMQLPGKKPLTIKEILNGKPDLFKAGMQFDLPPTKTDIC